MPTSIDGPDFDALAQRLSTAGTNLDRIIGETVDRELGTLPEAVRASALRTLPSSGGLNQRVAGRVRPQKRASAREVTVFAVGSKGLKELAALDRGKLRHPVYGNREAWVSQSVPRKFWTRPLLERADAIKRAVKARMKRLADEI